MLESGKSLKWANEYYRQLGYETKTASILILDETKYIPDFYLNRVKDKLKILCFGRH